jgi:26S proteasome regulatory subunit N5
MEIEQSTTVFSKEIQDLLVKERESRLNNDYTESARLLPEIVKIAFDSKEYEKLNELLTLLAKKRGQPKKAMIDMVQLSMSFIDKLPTEEQRLSLIRTIRDVCEKKIYLEVEYARCCLLLVKQNESDNNINEAAKILQDVQVETYGSMDKREKLEFILYQMKIMIKKKDYLRTLIISRKINKKNIEDAGIEDLKILFYSYLIFYYTHENKHFDNATCYKAIYDTLRKSEEVRKKTPEKIDFDFSLNLRNLLENYVMYLVIETHSNEQVKHLLDLQTNYADDLEQNPHLKNIVESILSTELISIDVKSYDLGRLEIFSGNVENTQQHVEQFRKQLIQHNIRIVAKYYERILLKRMAKLTGVDEDTVEAELCDAINQKLVSAKLDRVQGLVNFKQRKNENEILNDWRFDIHRILDLVDNTTNLINREYDVESAV